jgi:DNA-directed RNA polymerase subunit beta'
LIGLKENVIIGKLIPAGTGMKRYRDISLSTDKDFEMMKKLGDVEEVEEAAEDASEEVANVPEDAVVAIDIDGTDAE